MYPPSENCTYGVIQCQKQLKKLYLHYVHVFVFVLSEYFLCVGLFAARKNAQSSITLAACVAALFHLSRFYGKSCSHMQTPYCSLLTRNAKHMI
jgi:hypothetical protein